MQNSKQLPWIVQDAAHMLMNLEIRTCREEDLTGIVKIQEDILRRKVTGKWIDLVKFHLNKPEGICLAAVSEGEVVGYFCGQVKHGYFGMKHSGWIEMFGVSPKTMGHGAGQALARKAFDLFREHGVSDIYTAVRWDSGDLLAFFKSIGFNLSNFINLRNKLD